MNYRTAAIILAAGKGKRMKSDLPKVLHQIKGKPLIRHLLETISKVGFEKITVVVGHKGEMVIEELGDFQVEFVWQREQLGTGHAVQMAKEKLSGFDGSILVAAGDVPFLSENSIRSLIELNHRTGASATCLTADFNDPTGYGRIIRQGESDMLSEIIEEKDADEKIKGIKEINSGTFCFRSTDLFAALEEVKNNNAQKEYYLTDTIKILRMAGKDCRVWKTPNPLEVTGINSAEELAQLEKKIIL
jgi:bifunctional UDP-N-acetylglucosamine pyrophosphorylase/glucosamine-1-phosphate N-acetyltransferase